MPWALGRLRLQCRFSWIMSLFLFFFIPCIPIPLPPPLNPLKLPPPPKRVGFSLTPPRWVSPQACREPECKSVWISKHFPPPRPPPPIASCFFYLFENRILSPDEPKFRMSSPSAAKPPTICLPARRRRWAAPCRDLPSLNPPYPPPTTVVDEVPATLILDNPWQLRVLISSPRSTLF